jgi:hypothetical protein
VSDALRKLDIEAIFFFMGILLAVGALDAAGLLQRLAVALSAAVPNAGIVAAAIGVVSAVVDNVPLVAASMGMYDLSRVPMDSQLWQLIALCAGEGPRAVPQPAAWACACIKALGPCGFPLHAETADLTPSQRLRRDGRLAAGDWLRCGRRVHVDRGRRLRLVCAADHPLGRRWVWRSAGDVRPAARPAAGWDCVRALL